MSDGAGVAIQRISCRYHPNAVLVDDYHAGDVICSECGLVVQDRVIDVSSEWRTFGNSGDKDTKDSSRVGAAENLLLEGDLSTSIQFSRNDADSIGFKNSQRNLGGSNKALIEGFSEIKQVGCRMNLEKRILDDACKWFKDAYDSKQFRGRSRAALTAACIGLSCRKNQVTRSFKELCGASGASKKDIGKAYKLMGKIFKPNVNLVSSEDFINRFCSNLYLDRKVNRLAERIVRRVGELNIAPGRSPISVASAAILMACQRLGQSTTCKEISDVAGAAEATITLVYNIFKPHEDVLIKAETDNQIPSLSQ